MALSAAPRSTSLLRWAGALEGSTLLASRGFSSASASSLDMDPAAGPSAGALEAASSAAADTWPAAAAAGGTADSLAAAAGAVAGAADGITAAAEAGSNIGPIMNMTMAAVDGLHATTGLPWWATISAVGVLVRTAMLPVSLKGVKATSALIPLLRQARQDVAAAMQPPLAAAAVQAGEASYGQERRDSTKAKKQRWQRAQEQAAAAAAAAQQAAAPPLPAAPPPPPISNAAILARFQELRRQAGAPHPIWALASPLAQLPVFITAMATIRTMSLNNWPGFSSGGTAWFQDLTLPAMDLANWTAPMGTAGVVLPLAVAVAMFANIDAAFSVPAGSRQQASVMLWMMGGLRLLLEWVNVGLFALALQLPQGTLCYWATSSSLALLQNHALKHPAVRKLVGLPSGPVAMPQQAAMVPPAPGAAQAAAAAVAAGAAGPVAAGVDAELRQFLLTTSDQAALFEKAAALRAEGRAGACSTVLQRLLQLYPGQPNALYALGQVHAALKDWPLSEQCYLQAAQNPQLDAQSRSRSWFGAAVAMHMQGEHDTAIDAFKKAADAAQTDELRVRCWVSQATLHRKLGEAEEAVQLLRKAARAEPRVEEVYLKPLLAELAGEAGGQAGEAGLEGHQQGRAEVEAGAEAPQGGHHVLEEALDVQAKRQGEK